MECINKSRNCAIINITFLEQLFQPTGRFLHILSLNGIHSYASNLSVYFCIHFDFFLMSGFNLCLWKLLTSKYIASYLKGLLKSFIHLGHMLQKNIHKSSLFLAQSIHSQFLSCLKNSTWIHLNDTVKKISFHRFLVFFFTF